MAATVEKFFSKADFDAIEAAVKKAESTTSGELAIELASHSKHWRTEKLIHALAFTLICMSAALVFTRQVHWGVYYDVTQALLWGTIGFLLAYFGWGRYLTRLERRRAVVWNRALELFHQITPTTGQTGVLIYISLEEHQAAIVADKGIASKVSAEYWHEPHGLIVKGMREHRHAEGVVEAVEMISVELAKHFPRKSDDVNELPDRPRIDH